MSLFVFIALGVSFAFVVGAIAFAVARALEAWRSFRRFRRRVFEGLDALTQRVEHIERDLDRVEAATGRIQRAQAELQESLAAARVLLAAFAEVRAVVATVTGLVPGK